MWYNKITKGGTAVTDAIIKLDYAALNAIQNHMRCKPMDKLMTAVTKLGDKGLVWIITAFTMLFIPSYRKCGLSLIFGLAAGLVYGNLIAKNLVRRNRPCWVDGDIPLLIEIPLDFSFPSCHTMSCFAASFVIMHYDRLIAIPALIFAASVAFSRMYLYVHFPTDVVGGVLLAILVYYTAINITEHFFP